MACARHRREKRQRTDEGKDDLRGGRRNGSLLKDLCRWKGIEIIEGETATDYVHLLLLNPSKMSASGTTEYIEGKSGLIIYQNTGRRSVNIKAENFGVVAAMQTQAHSVFSPPEPQPI